MTGVEEKRGGRGEKKRKNNREALGLTKEKTSEKENEGLREKRPVV